MGAPFPPPDVGHSQQIWCRRAESGEGPVRTTLAIAGPVPGAVMVTLPAKKVPVAKLFTPRLLPSAARISIWRSIRLVISRSMLVAGQGMWMVGRGGGWEPTRGVGPSWGVARA